MKGGQKQKRINGGRESGAWKDKYQQISAIANCTGKYKASNLRYIIHSNIYNLSPFSSLFMSASISWAKYTCKEQKGKINMKQKSTLTVKQGKVSYQSIASSFSSKAGARPVYSRPSKTSLHI